MQRESGRVVLVLLLLFLFIALVIGGVIFGLRKMRGVSSIASGTVLQLDFGEQIVENAGSDVLSTAFLGQKLLLRDLVQTLHRAADDDRVVALVARVDTGGMGMATIQEIRDAVTAFRDSGKPTIAYNDTFGEWGPANGAYYLASAFEQIHVQPSGDLGLTGLRYETPFLRGAFDKLEMEPRLDHRHEFKNAMNMYTEREFTPSHEEALGAVMRSQFDQLVEGVSSGRGMSVPQVRALVDRGPYYGQEILDAGLVDGLSYWDQIYDQLYAEFGDDLEFTSPTAYVADAGGMFEDGETVALIYGLGGVTRGESDYDPLTGAQSMGSDTVAQAFRDAIDDEDVRGILFRVDSPGGSYVASDTIWRETVRAREAGKPVVVSMGNVAGSGGYFVAMSADRIVAQPGTITGSIGVLGGKLLTRSAWSKLGVSWDAVETSDNAGMWTAIEDYGEVGYERFQRGLDRIYEDFTEKVAGGREMPLEEVQRIAKGRIWSGRDALEIGLVDDLGGYLTALSALREELDLEPGTGLALQVFPQPKSPLEAWLEGGFSVRSDSSAALVQAFGKRLRPILTLVDRLGVTAEPQVLSMPDAALAEGVR